MKKANDDLFVLDVEYEYKKLIRNGEKISIEEFLNRYDLDVDERNHILRRLQRWEKSNTEFEEYRKSFDFDGAYKKIMQRINQEVSSKYNLWDKAVRYLASIDDRIANFEFGSDWIKQTIPARVTLSTGIFNADESHEVAIYRLTEGPLAGIEVEPIRNNRIIIRLNRVFSKSSKLLFVDKDGQPIDIPIVYGPDKRGKVVCDFSKVSNLPPFEIRIDRKE